MEETMSVFNAFFSGIGLVEMTIPRTIMILLAFCLMYLAVVKKYEPLLLLPLSFGIMLANIPLAGLDAYFIYDDGRRGLLNFLYQGIIGVIYPPLIFLCIGSMTDFGPLISSPRSALIGLGGQLGIFVAFWCSLMVSNLISPYIPGFEGFTFKQAAAIGIIGSSDGPTSIFTATRLAPEILPSVAIAAFSYMALVPFIQPPIMKLLTTDKERVIIMPEPKRVTQRQKILFPIIVALVTLMLVPTAGA